MAMAMASRGHFHDDACSGNKSARGYFWPVTDSSRHHRRGTHRRRSAALGVVAAGCLAIAACSAGPPTAGSAPNAARTTAPLVPLSVPSTNGSQPTPTAPATTTSTVDPGLLPQIAEQPSTGEPLTARMRLLWQAIVSGGVDAALPLFFPEQAYQSMKSGMIPNPTGDYNERLLSFYRLDLGAYHDWLGPDGSMAVLTGVNVTAADVAWIPSRSCENLVGYWHLPGVRLVYRVDGVIRSVAVASLISWRGVWYVVHLGPNPRPKAAGTVDQPALGPGTPGPPGGC